MRADGKPFITVYAICKNESKFVDRWMDSMSEADAVVVLDTGSTDDTVEKLRARGAEVEVQEVIPWRFDIPRNVSMTLCPEETDLYVCTDLDEVMVPGWAEALRTQYKPGAHRYWYKFSWAHAEDGKDSVVFWYNKIHVKGYHWQYPVHETLTPDSPDMQERSVWLDDSVHLHHWPDNAKSRGQYLPLLELRVEENPDDPYSNLYLAREYRYYCRYKESIIAFNNLLDNKKLSQELSDAEKAFCYSYIGDNWLDLSMEDEAVAAYKTGILAKPTYRENYIKLAKIFLKRQDFVSAAKYLSESLRKGIREYSWLEESFAWSYEPYDLLCQAYWYAGAHSQAIACAAVALSMSPNDARLKSNLELCINLAEPKDF